MSVYYVDIDISIIEIHIAKYKKDLKKFFKEYYIV